MADFRFLKLVDFAFRPFPYCLSMILMMNFWLLPIGTNFLFYKRGLAHFIVVLSLETLRCTLWLYIHLYRFCTAIDILQTRCQFDWNTYISILNSTWCEVSKDFQKQVLQQKMLPELSLIYGTIPISNYQRVSCY